MKTFTDAMLAGAETVLARETAQLAEHRAVEDEALAYAAKTKTPLAAPFWQARFKAEQRVRAAAALVDALKDKIR
jgi:hypothetical protein